MTLIYTVILLLISLTAWCGLNVWEVWCYGVFLDHQLLVNLERHSSPQTHHTPTHSQTHLQLHMRAISFLFTVNSDICPKWRLATPLLHNWQNCKANLCSLPHCSLQISPRLLLYSAPNLALVCSQHWHIGSYLRWEWTMWDSGRRKNNQEPLSLVKSNL